jgi:Transmembrane protein 65
MLQYARLQRPAIWPAAHKSQALLDEETLRQRKTSNTTTNKSHVRLPRRHRPSPRHSAHEVQPSYEILRQHLIANAIPMIGFGIMDQTLMLHAGNAIDCTLGVTLGISTLSAAAVGQIVSNGKREERESVKTKNRNKKS